MPYKDIAKRLEYYRLWYLKNRERYRKDRKGYAKGEKHYLWKGDKVGSVALHAWVRRNKPKSEICENCKQIKSRLEAANISQRYKRDVNDFKWLCRKCHQIEDGRLEKWNKLFNGNFKGKKHTLETKQRMRTIRIGKRLSKETRKKISLAKIGHIPWNKGLTKEDPRVLAYIKSRKKGINNV